MALAKQARLHGLGVGKQAARSGLSAGLLRRIRAAIAAKTIRPGVAPADHPAGDIFTLQMKDRDGAAIVVFALRADLKLPARQAPRQGRA